MSLKTNTTSVSITRSDLEHYPLYQQRFRKFNVLSQAAVRTVVLKAKPTNCTSGPVPTKLLKEHIDTLLPIITRIVNLLLSNGQFAECWKVPIIKPLVKKKGLECILKNYRPVNNLSFISKLVERA